MIFGEFGLDDALGAVLAHTTRLPQRLLLKGTVLDAAALHDLGRAGMIRVTAARLEPGDIAEDEAAARLAQALLAPGLSMTRTGTGRTNLAASHAGLFRADAAAIDAINALHEGLTIGTLADATPVYPGDLLATVKIIPFALPAAVLAQAEELARLKRPVRLPAFRPLRTGLIVTVLPGTKDSVIQSTRAVTEARIRGLTGCVLPPVMVPHERAAIAAALQSLTHAGAELLLVAGASAAVDRGDVAPAAIVSAGGAIDHFGMPVDPGNLICVGHIDAIPALILPGCARSPKLNGIDLVLARVFAGEPAGSGEIARMGVGGLLKDFASRPSRRSGLGKAPAPVAALVLAAGLSRRMAPANKLLIHDASGEPMVARVVAAARASRAVSVTVVVGHQADQIAATLPAEGVSVVHAARYADGLAGSLHAGVAALPPGTAAAIVCLGDMPLVTSAMIDQIIAAYDQDKGSLIVVPTHTGKRGNPVLWDRRFFPDIMALTGDTGARSLLLRHAGHVAEIEVGSDAILTDFDTPAALERRLA